MTVAVCLKWVDARPEIDPVSGVVTADDRFAAASPADRTALEQALRLADGTGREVVAVTAGPAGADVMLRDALAVGATRAVRVAIDPALDADAVARAVEPVVAEADLVLCGGWSLDRGTGSVPAFLAHHLGVAQALGCTRLEASGGSLLAERRLDGGRREQVRLDGRAVVSLEAGAPVRRAPLPAVLAAADAPVEVVEPEATVPTRSRLEERGPYRPRSRELAPPLGADTRERLLSLTGALADEAPSRALRADPGAAADQLLAALAERGVGPEADPVR